MPRTADNSPAEIVAAHVLVVGEAAGAEHDGFASLHGDLSVRGLHAHPYDPTVLVDDHACRAVLKVNRDLAFRHQFGQSCDETCAVAAGAVRIVWEQFSTPRCVHFR